MNLTRRHFTSNALLASGGAILGCAKRIPRGVSTHPPSVVTSPDAAASGIEHIVVVTMENRSFDHFLGWLPNADGKQAGLRFADKAGTSHETHTLSGDYNGCPGADPDHSYVGARIAYNHGRMDGFLRAGSNDPFSIGFYGEKDIPFYAALARNYTTCDRYFASMLGPTFPNRMFIYAAQADRLTDSVALSSLPTIWDRLAQAGVKAHYYYSNVPYLAFWGVKYLNICKQHDDFLEAARAGTLPAVSFVDPRYTILDDGFGNDDHPHADIRKGDKFLYDLFEAVSKGPQWSSTVFIVNFDEWGGFFDHVPPPRAEAANSIDTDIAGGKTLLGLRVPAVIASPFSRGDPANPRVSSELFDHTAVLKLIEWRWGLKPLTPRDGGKDIANLLQALDLRHVQPAVPALPKPDPPLIAAPCIQNLFGGIFTPDASSTATTSKAETIPGATSTGAGPVSRQKTAALKSLQEQAKQHGFPIL